MPGVRPVPPARLRTARALAARAVKMRKVFLVQGPYPVVRAALRARGWVECCVPRTSRRYGNEDQDDDDDFAGADERADGGIEEENIDDDTYDLMSRLVRKERVHFYWTMRRDAIDWPSLRSDQMANHYANAGAFTTKVGLCVGLRKLHWFDAADPDTFFPRCYRLAADDERHAFIGDFRRTACTSLLQHVVETGSGSAQAEGAEPGCVGAQVVHTALRVCQEFLDALEHSDIDVSVESPPPLQEQQWAELLEGYNQVVHGGAWLGVGRALEERCRSMLVRLQEVCPQLDMDGVHNIWILKPGALSRGRGIVCLNRLEDILALADADRGRAKERNWVVQKYLERPLLVNGTKFDLRQWFLVTDWNPLTVWFYDECYLRFSTQPYSTHTLDSSVHLCNNSIQKHLQPSRCRHPGVPTDNMWSCSQFRAFLRREGREAEWGRVSVPGMQRALVRALQTAQDLVEPRRASFQLLGADFLLGRDMTPWLLEINSSPTMACSTPVTARLCPAVQRDTLRVVLDRRNDPGAATGGFRLIHKQPAVEVPQYVGVHLVVEGAPIRPPGPPPRRQASASALPRRISSHRLSGRALRPPVQKIAAVQVCFSPAEERQVPGGRRRQEAWLRRTSCTSDLPVLLNPHPRPRKRMQRLGLSGLSFAPDPGEGNQPSAGSPVRVRLPPLQANTGTGSDRILAASQQPTLRKSEAGYREERKLSTPEKKMY